MTGAALLAVFAGGGAGATCRYGIGRLVGARYGGAFPLGTFLINVTGCFALGLVDTLLARARGGAVLPAALLETGFLSGYTTFSTYALEAVLLYRDSRPRLAAYNALGSVLAGLLAAALGAALGVVLFRLALKDHGRDGTLKGLRAGVLVPYSRRPIDAAIANATFQGQANDAHDPNRGRASTSPPRGAIMPRIS